ncbi:hypothetical protein BC940DRAFT_235023 [Gongronella butleri]|nr:hypothetical protein BC940DRAFT_235023 [Gongronella butleri]
MDPHAEPQQHSLEPPSKRKRLTQACDMCRKKKIKCDGGKPSCANCVKLGRECSYIPSNKKRGPRQGYIEMLEKRLDKMEKLLTSSNDPSPGAAAAAASLPTPTAYTAAAIGTQSPTSPMHAAGFPVTPTAANPSAPNPLVIKPDYEPQGMPAPAPPPPPTSATAAAPPPTIDDSPSDGDLPNKSIVQHLITIYFDKLYSYAPLFDPRTFMRNYLDGKHSDFLLLSMMAVAARYDDK